MISPVENRGEAKNMVVFTETGVYAKLNRSQVVTLSSGRQFMAQVTGVYFLLEETGLLVSVTC